MNDPAVFQQVFEASPNPYMIVDAQLRFVAANRAYLAITGSRLEDLLGKPLLEAFPHDASRPDNENLRRLRSSLLKVLATGERDDIALIHYRVAREPGGPAEDRYVRGLRILVVEDEPDTRELLRGILTTCGAFVEVASSVSEGLEAIRRAPPDVLLSDIGMPADDGYTFIRRVRALPESEGGRVPAIAVTAFARTEDRTAALRAGFRAHVPKPIDISELLAVIASLAPSQL